MSSGRDIAVTFAVNQVWRGPETQTLTVKTAASSTSCGYSFQEDNAYLVYANEEQDTENGDLAVSLCSRTTSLEDAEQDINALGAGTSISTGQTAGENRTQHDGPVLGFGAGLFLAMVVPPLLALIAIIILILLATGQTGRWLAATGSIGTLGGLIGVYTLVSNPNTAVLLTADPLFAVAMIAPLLLGVTALIQWYTG